MNVKRNSQLVTLQCTQTDHPICKQIKAPNDQKHWKSERKNTTYIHVNRPLAQLFNFKIAKYQKLPIDYRSNKPISIVTLSAKY